LIILSILGEEHKFYLFTYFCLFNDTVNNSRYTAPMVGWSMNDELDKIRKEVAFVCLIVILVYPYLPGMNKKNHDKLQLGYSVSRLAPPSPPECRWEAFPTPLSRSFKLLRVLAKHSHS
jgi:hypothetical protein